MRRFAFLIVLVAALCLPTTALAGQSSAPGNSGAAHRCSDGGYLNLHRSDGSSFADHGKCTSYAAQSGVFLEDMPVTLVPLTLVGECTPFNDSVFYAFTFGPGATPALTSLSYTYTAPADSGIGPPDTFTGTIMSTETSATTGPSPLSFIRSVGLTEIVPGTYRFEMRIGIGETPGPLTVSDGTHTATAAVPDGSTAIVFCADH